MLLLHYDDLKADLDGQMRVVAAQLGIPVDEARWRALVDAATFDRMRANADRVAPDTTNQIWQDNQQFFHRGDERPVAEHCSTTPTCSATTRELWSSPTTTSRGGCTARRELLRVA